MIGFVEFEHGSAEYRRVLALRDAVLRKPLGLAYEPSFLAAEREHRHFALFDDGTPVACLIAALLAEGVYKLRQMAVVDDRRREGLGRRLVEEVERTLRNSGATEFTLHARGDAVGFYQRLGYTPVGEEFIEVTLPHQAMRKEA